MSNRSLLALGLGLLAIVSFQAIAQAQGGRPPRQQRSFSNNNEFGDFISSVMAGDEAAQAAELARAEEAERNFDAIVLPQNQLDHLGNLPPAVDIRDAGGLGMLHESRMHPDQHQKPMNQAYPAPSSRLAAPASQEPQVKMGLDDYARLRDRLNRVRKQAARWQGPAVVLGASRYHGQAIQGALSLRLELQVTLGRPDSWKTVPIVGDDVVLVSAQVDGKDLPISRRQGYHVWVTRDSGETTIQAQILVPSRGPRGSIEYNFLVARTPVTSFECLFPAKGLEPRMNAAVQSQAQNTEKGTLFSATLRPTTHIHMLGFKDLGDDAGQQAKTYAESLHLLSVEEGALELFSVLRYTILYAGTKEFLLRLPDDMKVISAEGMGAFSWELRQNEAGERILRGETAFPIRNKFEISLRLRRELPKDGDGRFDAPLPRCLDVERESGWLGLEVPGKLQLETMEPKAADAIDVRQLPVEMIRSAVSPILRAYRYHDPNPQIGLQIQHLPEIEPASDSVDRVRAFTKVTAEGNVLTEMRITLRNRLLQNLKMRLPRGAAIKSALLDGQPLNPSRNAEGLVLLPLKRSLGRDQLRPFTLSVVLEQNLGPMGLWGWPTLEMPRLDLPISSLAWTVFAPGRNLYTRMKGEFETQQYMGRAEWHTPGGGAPTTHHGTRPGTMLQAVSISDGATSADAGAMPVRFKVPQEGRRLEYNRYWIGAEAPVEVSFTYARSWLRIPAWLGLALLLAFGLWLFSLKFRPLPSQGCPWLGAVLAIPAAWGALRLGGGLALALGLGAGFLIIAVHRSWLRRSSEAFSAWASNLREGFRQRPRDPQTWRSARVATHILLSIGLCFFGLLLLKVAFSLLWLLFHPLGG